MLLHLISILHLLINVSGCHIFVYFLNTLHHLWMSRLHQQFRYLIKNKNLLKITALIFSFIVYFPLSLKVILFLGIFKYPGHLNKRLTFKIEEEVYTDYKTLSTISKKNIFFPCLYFQQVHV